MNYTEEDLAKVVDLGKLGYPWEKCANILAVQDREEFKKDFHSPQSQIYKNYQIGTDLADFELDTKVFQLAKTGDLKAIQEFEKRRKRFG